MESICLFGCAWMTFVRVLILQAEEGIMMPLTPLTGDTVEKRGAIVREILNIDRKEFNDFQFGYVLETLMIRKKDWCGENSTKNEKQQKMSKGAIKMYCLGTQMASNKDEYKQLQPKIKEIVDAKTYAAISKQVEQEGKQ